MTDAQELPEPKPQSGGLSEFAVPAVLAALLLLAATWGWSAHRSKAEAEAALATAVAERDAAVQAVEQSKGELTKAQAAANAGEVRVAELEQQVAALDGLLAGANAELTRLRTESATRPAPAAAAAPAVAAEKVEEATSQAQPAIAAVEPAAAAPVATPTPASPPKPETLTITFDVNSSYLPDDLNGRLRALARKLEADRSYQVKLVGAVGTGDVAGRSADEARRYNRWIAERRVERVADYLQRTASAAELKIERRFAANDPSRRVQVVVTPAVD
jgi:hypothetical protein